MNRVLPENYNFTGTIPRASGDEPLSRPRSGTISFYSPRQRG